MDNERIVSDPHILGNRPCIRGTRVPVERILEELADGHSIDSLAVEFLVEKADIVACINFAHSVVGKHWREFLANPVDLEED